jgi:anti-sigma regulatory factor (Ser/Thr protein kinase)
MEVAVNLPLPNSPRRFVVDDASKVGEVRRSAQMLANFELGAAMAGKVAIAATELANNLLRHAGSGELLVQVLVDGDNTGLELLSIDRGPGMSDVSRCMADGYSTGGTPGTGLGAIRRLACEFDIHSMPGEGTVVMARFGVPPPLRYGAVCVTLEGETESGDAWRLEHGPDGIAVVIVDGLGHGSFAAEAARAGIDAFVGAPFTTPAEILSRANAAMSKTRGGAAAAAWVRGTMLSYAGVGNICGVVVGAGRSRGLVSHNGTLGAHQRRPQQFEYPFEPGSLLVMHSDGLSARWDLGNRPDVLGHHPAIVAGILYRDHARERDDATVVVVSP